ncbi:MAG: hypothetical protein GX851_03100, partial [Clostridiales bacterium]|nr:hypothetical protein [Clostridiales bacterium]
MQDNGETSDATDPAMQESSGIQHKEGVPSRVDDYGVIEALFLEYAGKLKERYTLYNTNSAVDYAIPGTGTPTAAPGNDAAEAPAVDSFNGSGDHGSTNIQVSGVDEADILKNDGHYLYAVSVGLGQICIIDPKPDAMKILCE